MAVYPLLMLLGVSATSYFVLLMLCCRMMDLSPLLSAMAIIFFLGGAVLSLVYKKDQCISTGRGVLIKINY